MGSRTFYNRFFSLFIELAHWKGDLDFGLSVGTNCYDDDNRHSFHANMDFGPWVLTLRMTPGGPGPVPMYSEAPHTVAHTLARVRNILTDPRNWTKGVYAKGANGDYTDFDSEKAMCFCIRGAISRATRLSPSVSLYGDASKALEAEVPGGSRLAAYNDAKTTTHADIMALINRAWNTAIADQGPSWRGITGSCAPTIVENPQ